MRGEVVWFVCCRSVGRGMEMGGRVVGVRAGSQGGRVDAGGGMGIMWLLMLRGAVAIRDSVVT